jgi:DNA-binding MarR family transcriptional regulator
MPSNDELASERPRALDAITALHFVQLTSSHVLTKAATALGIAPADLRVLYFLGVEPLATPKRVATHMGLTTGAVTSLVDRLVDGAFAERSPNPEDRRSVLLSLTPKGRDAVAELSKLYGAAFLESIDPAQMTALAASLTALSDALGGVSRDDESA